MKIKELVDNKLPHVFLDMDGVQCDFAGAIEEVVGMTRDEAKQKTEDEIERLAHSSPQTVRQFFSDLKQLAGGKKIVDWLNTHNVPYTILSAPLRGRYGKASILGKQEWLSKHTPAALKGAIFMHDKHKYAMAGGKPNVLIDDYGKKIAAWEAAGGIAIQHADEFKVPDAAERTIKRLEQIFLKKDKSNEQ